jgi:hypothetical protein
LKIFIQISFVEFADHLLTSISIFKGQFETKKTRVENIINKTISIKVLFFIVFFKEINIFKNRNNYLILFTIKSSEKSFHQSHGFNFSSELLCQIAIKIKSQTVFKSRIGGFDDFSKLACIYDFISAKSRLSRNNSKTRLDSHFILSFDIHFISDNLS